MKYLANTDLKIASLDAVLHRCERPKSFAQLKALGITTVIKIGWGVHEAVNDDQYEHENPDHFGIVVHTLRCDDIFAPSDSEVSQFLDLVKAAPGKVAVHCKFGKDRTGFMCAVYRMVVQGWSYEAAKEELYDMGFHKFPYLFWLMTLKKYRR